MEVDGKNIRSHQDHLRHRLAVEEPRATLKESPNIGENLDVDTDPIIIERRSEVPQNTYTNGSTNPADLGEEFMDPNGDEQPPDGKIPAGSENATTTVTPQAAMTALPNPEPAAPESTSRTQTHCHIPEPSTPKKYPGRNRSPSDYYGHSKTS